MADVGQNKRQRDHEGENHDDKKKAIPDMPPPPKRFAYDFNNTMSVLVGRQEQHFAVHKDVICAKSKFFKAACSERWTRGKFIKLPEKSTRDFQTYVHWIYTSLIELCNENSAEIQEELSDMYILGDMLDDFQIRNAAMERLINNIAFLSRRPTVNFTKHVYECTPMESPLRKFFVDQKIGRAKLVGFGAAVAKYPVEFIQELAVALMSKTSSISQSDFVADLRSSFEPETQDA